MNPFALLLLAGLGFALYEWSQNGGSSYYPNASGTMINSSQYANLPNYLTWAALITSTEASNGIPSGMLARLLYQESGYQTAVISGSQASSAGAQGIAQFMPATAQQLGINALDPSQAIPAAGQYLAQLYQSTGSWIDAVAAYNWGIGNVQNWLAGNGATPPTETLNYVAAITGQQLTGGSSTGAGDTGSTQIAGAGQGDTGDTGDTG